METGDQRVVRVALLETATVEILGEFEKIEGIIASELVATCANPLRDEEGQNEIA